MLIIFFQTFILAKPPPTKDCPKSIDTVFFGRCLIKDSLQINKMSSAAIYLHGNSESTISVKPKNESDLTTIFPGNGLQIFPSDSILTCNKKENEDCFVSLWVSDYDKDKAYFVSDGPGCVYKGVTTIPERYPSFFDFGDQGRIEVKKFQHRRENGLTVYTVDPNNGTYLEHLLSENNKYLTLNGPGIIHISSSPYLETSFEIIVGSTVLMPSEFSNNPRALSFNTLKYSSKKDKYTYSEGGKRDIYVQAAKESKGWYYLSYVFLGITAFLLLSSVISFTFITVKRCRQIKRVDQEKRQ